MGRAHRQVAQAEPTVIFRVGASVTGILTFALQADITAATITEHLDRRAPSTSAREVASRSERCLCVSSGSGGLSSAA